MEHSARIFSSHSFFFGVKKSREPPNKFVLAHGKSERKVRKGNFLAKVDIKDAYFTLAAKKSSKCSCGFTGKN